MEHSTKGTSETKRWHFALLASVCLHLTVGGFVVPHASFGIVQPKHSPLEILRLPDMAPVTATSADAAPPPLPPDEKFERRKPSYAPRSGTAPAAERNVLTVPPAPIEASVELPVAPGPAVSLTAELPVATPSQPVVDDGKSLEAYTQALSDQIGRQRAYPRLARVRGWEGTSTLHLRLASDGRLREATLAGSSGRDLLDQQALEMAKRLSSWPLPPEALRNGEFSVLVPVVFRLQDERQTVKTRDGR